MNDIELAVKQFEELLNEQYSRVKKMKTQSAPKDFKTLDKVIIGLVDGDGIGPVIMKSARTVLEKLLDKELKEDKIELRRIEGLTIENRLKLNQSVPEKTLRDIKACDVILKGPTQTPKGGTLESANVTLRRELDLYANVRPVQVPEESIDWTFFRENTEGEYVLGSRGITVNDELAVDFKVITDPGTERIARAAFEFAKNNGKTDMAVITKANIMKKTDGRFSEICHRVGSEYPDIKVEDWYIDIMAANLVNKEIRNRFQVFVLPNLYGDIITDEAAEIQGGVGTAGSANIGDQYAMFEAIHGTAPRLIEEGLGAFANPSSILKATELMLKHMGMTEKAAVLSEALKKAGDIGKLTCAEFTDKIVGLI